MWSASIAIPYKISLKLYPKVYFDERAILSVLNTDINQLNHCCITKLSEMSNTFLSIDAIINESRYWDHSVLIWSIFLGYHDIPSMLNNEYVMYTMIYELWKFVRHKPDKYGWPESSLKVAPAVDLWEVYWGPVFRELEL